MNFLSPPTAQHNTGPILLFQQSNKRASADPEAMGQRKPKTILREHRLYSKYGVICRRVGGSTESGTSISTLGQKFTGNAKIFWPMSQKNSCPHSSNLKGPHRFLLSAVVELYKN